MMKCVVSDWHMRNKRQTLFGSIRLVPVPVIGVSRRRRCPPQGEDKPPSISDSEYTSERSESVPLQYFTILHAT